MKNNFNKYSIDSNALRSGRFRAGAALGALIVGFSATPALAQYAAGGATATGAGAVGVGPGSTAPDPSGVAIGNGATAGVPGVQLIDLDGDGIFEYTQANDTAIGANARAIGGDSIALGTGAVANHTYDIAIGSGSTTTGLGTVALGRNNTVDSYGVGSTTVTQGVLNRATGVGSVTLGNGTTGAVGVGIGIGQANIVDGAGIAIGGSNLANNAGSTTIAIGIGNAASGAYGQALGVGNTASGGSATAIGVANIASNNTAIALGRQNTASGQTSIALGNVATASNTNAIAIGHSTQATANGAIAIGGGNNGALTNLDATSTRASNTNAVAIGTASAATAASSIALGDGATAGQVNAVALGSGSVTAASNTGAFTLNGGTIAGTAGTSTVSVGATGNERQIQNVGAGVVSATSTNAINGSQLFTVASAVNTLGSSVSTLIGGGTVIASNGSITTLPAITVGGVVYNNVTTATHANDAKATTIGAGLISSLGGGASIAANGTVTNPNYTIGSTTYTDVGSALNALASSAGPGPVRYANAGTPTTPNGGAATQNLTLVGAAAGPVTLDNVAPGSTAAGSTQAVNGGQINTGLASVATHLGGGSTYNPVTGTVTAPSYSVQGTAHNTVGSALTGVDTALTGLSSGASGLLQFSDSGSPTTPNGGIASQNMTLVGATAGQAVTLSNLAGGAINATSSDAVNGAQLFALGSALGGGSIFGPGSMITPPAYTINGTRYSNAGDAFAAINTSLTGGGIKYFHTNSTLSDSAPVGINAIAIGPVSGAAGDQSISLGLNANAGGPDAIALGTNSTATGISSISIGNGNRVNGNRSGAIGDPSVVTGSDSYAVGNNNNIFANNAFVFGNNVTISAGLDGSVALGNDTTVGFTHSGDFSITGGIVAGTSPVSVVSVGSTGNERQVQNVAAGVLSATSTDAINGSQLFSVATALNSVGTSLGTLIGGGTVLGSDGTIITPPTITVGGIGYTNVTAAIEAGDARTTTAHTGLAAALGGGAAVAANGTVTAPNYVVQGNATNNVGAALAGVDAALTGLANGTAGLVQQSGGSPSAGQISVGATTGGTTLSVAGTAGNRVVTGVAAGGVAAGSTDAVNGGQLFAVQTLANGALQTSGGTMTGAINMGGNSITNLAAPVNAGDAANRAYVDAVAATAATSSVALGQSVAAGLGGGAIYNSATGQVSTPNYTVAGQTYNNAGAALAATHAVAVQYVADANGQPTNAVHLNGNGNGQTVALSNVAAGAVTATSTEAVNGGQLYGVQQAAAGAVQYDRTLSGGLDRSSVTLGRAGTLTTLGNVAAGLRATDAANVGQLQTGLAGVLSQANVYTDTKIGALSFDLNSIAKRAYAGTAAAMALQAPGLFEPGKLVMRMGTGAYRGQIAFGASFRATAESGRWSVSGGVSGGKNSGVAASAGVDFIIGD